jgi:hypothetical protein
MRLQTLAVEIHTQARLLGLDGNEALVRDESTGEKRSLGFFDSVLVAVGHRSYDPLSAELIESGFEVEVIGDARNPGQVWDATQDGRAAVTARVANEG